MQVSSRKGTEPWLCAQQSTSGLTATSEREATKPYDEQEVCVQCRCRGHSPGTGLMTVSMGEAI